MDILYLPLEVLLYCLQKFSSLPPTNDLKCSLEIGYHFAWLSFTSRLLSYSFWQHDVNQREKYHHLNLVKVLLIQGASLVNYFLEAMM
jgi:hypothetical protein